jgi:hypothetical protein
MKRRIRRIANFFAFNLLFFALYLNFIHKDNATAGIHVQNDHTTAAVVGTVPVSQPEKYLEPKTAVSTQETNPESNIVTKNLSIN